MSRLPYDIARCNGLIMVADQVVECSVRVECRRYLQRNYADDHSPFMSPTGATADGCDYFMEDEEDDLTC